jgi:hypothetical protein
MIAAYSIIIGLSVLLLLSAAGVVAWALLSPYDPEPPADDYRHPDMHPLANHRMGQ